MNEDGKPKRTYSSALRERQEAETRDLILRALGDQILACRPGEFSLPEVAGRAGVSIRTVYRHFGSRKLLIEALEDYAVRQTTPPPPTTLEELLEFPPTLFAAFDEHAPWVEAMLRAGPGSAARAAGKPARIELFRTLIAPLVAGLPPEEAAGVHAVFKHLVSAETWLAMRRDFGVDGPTAGRTVSRTLRALAAHLKEDR